MLDDRFGESEVPFGITADGTLNAMEDIRHSNLGSTPPRARCPRAAAMARIKEVIVDTRMRSRS
jgi:hypothetical protein